MIKSLSSIGTSLLSLFGLPNKNSTLVALYIPWLYSDPRKPETERSQRAKIVIEQITETMRTNMIDGQCFFGRYPDKMSPWGLFFAYHICAINMRVGDSSPTSTAIAQSLKEMFEKIDGRWNAAGKIKFLNVV